MGRDKLLIAFPMEDHLVQRIRDTLGFESVKHYPSTYIRGTKHPKATWSHEPPDIPDDVWRETTVMQTMFIVPESRAQAPNLKYIQGMSAGIEHMLSSALFKEAPELVVASASGVHATNIAEYVMMQSLNAFHKQTILREIQFVDKGWTRTKYVPPGSVSGSPELRDHTIGILGYGCIGRECGRLASAFGMTVLAASSFGKQAPARGYIVEGTGDPEGKIPKAWYSSNDPTSLREFLEQVDVLVIACPLTNTTRGMISDKTIRFLKKTAYVINIARGPVIDHQALYTALEEDRIAGAILDVTDPEPLPKDHKLWTAKNCIVTPHVSGSGTRYEERCVDLLEINYKRWLEGEEVLNRVDISRGY